METARYTEMLVPTTKVQSETFQKTATLKQCVFSHIALTYWSL